MNDSEKIEYLTARVGALEAMINNIIDFNQITHDRYATCVPSQPNFWCEQMEQLRQSISQQLNENFTQE